MKSSFLQERITKLEILIAAYEDALLAIGSVGVESYTFDSGQTRQVVTKLNIPDMQKTLDGLYNRLCIFEARLNGGGTKIGRPSW